jgi:hypothetical protein
MTHRPGRFTLSIASFTASALWAGLAWATPFFFSTGVPDGHMATGSRPASAGKIEIETGDDFITPSGLTILTAGTFTGLLTGGATTSDIGEVRVEIYRVFPLDSDTVRTPQVPTRANSPSDVEFADRDTATANLIFSTTEVTDSFTADNSVLNNISVGAKGEGPVTGEEVLFNVGFTVPIVLPQGHYFFVPQVEITTADGEFLWLSAPRPIVAPGTPIMPDLQTWIRNEPLQPDWLRVGTDVVGGTTPPTFNAAFSLTGKLPEPGSLLLVAVGLVVAWWYWRKHKQ